MLQSPNQSLNTYQAYQLSPAQSRQIKGGTDTNTSTDASTESDLVIEDLLDP